MNIPDTGLESIFFAKANTISRYTRLVAKYDDKPYIITPNNITRYVSSLESGDSFDEIISDVN